MKKIFIEPLIVYIFTTAALLTYIAIPVITVILFFSGTISILVVVLSGSLTALVWWGLYTVMLPRQDLLIVTESYAEWWCLFRRKRRIYYDQCKRIAVETFNKESHGPVVRGDEFAMIYFTVDSYPEELRGRINRLRCTDEIIKFRYSDKLAKTVLDVAPKEKTRLLYSFYNQMQNYDSQIKRRRRKKRKK